MNADDCCWIIQLRLRKRVVYGAIGISWIVTPVFLTILGSMNTDIVQGVCIPWGVYRSYAGEKAFIAFGYFFTYLLPLIMMLFCYSRIVYALRSKVTTVL